jgi:hypothetical protein
MELLKLVYKKVGLDGVESGRKIHIQDARVRAAAL